MRYYILMIVATWLYAPALYVADGRLTDTACYLFILGVILFAVKIGMMENAVRRGALSDAEMPWWLQDRS